MNKFEIVLKKELDSASKSPYDEWSRSLLRLRDAYDDITVDPKEWAKAVKSVKSFKKYEDKE